MPDNVEYVPMYWGPKYASKWNQRKQEIKKYSSTRILAFNEPDIAGQSNMSPEYAATVFMRELEPYRKQGIKVSSPQIVWNIDWMDKFLKNLRAQGGDVDFMAVHWYGSYAEFSKFQTWVSKIHKRYNKSVWVTEYGITASSHPSQSDIKNFHIKATSWMNSVGYVKRAAWLGCFSVNRPPDSYAAARNAFFEDGGSLRAWSKWYVWSASSKRSEELPAIERLPRLRAAFRPNHARAHGALMEKRQELFEREKTNAVIADEDLDEEDDGVTYEGEALHCDALCEKRAQALSDAVDQDDALESEDDEGDSNNWVD